jgi:diguanylate cyclase (GGDEF)-like protein/PAS domain S-box-containing protein
MATAPEPLAVLLVEDDEDDYLITRDMLAGQERGHFHLDWRRSFDEALEAIRAQRHDVYLIDYRLGERTGLELIGEGFAARPLAPVLILTGESDYQIDLEASALGVTDYLLKQELTPTGLERSIRYAVSHAKALHALSQSEERYALAARAASDGIWDWDLATGHIYLSPRWHAILGRSEHSEADDPALWFTLVHEDDLVRLRAAIDAHLAGRSSHLELEHRMRHADGSWRWVLTRGLAIRGPDGEATRVAGSLSDITDRRAAERQLQHDALHDSLTGLPNRALFIDRVDQVLRRAERDPGASCAVLFLDIDRFKLVNDSFSHAVGDHLLVALAKRMTGVLRPSDTVARLGGDEFTMLLVGVSSPDEAIAVAQRVQESLAPQVTIDGHQLAVTATIGIAIGRPGVSAADLLRNADIAMYEARRRGRSASALFDDSMHRRVVDQLAHQRELRRAVQDGLLEVHYQPIVELATGRISGLEALARWPEAWSPVPPVEFIAIAEETGMIGAVGLHVLRTALPALAGWRRSGLLSSDSSISVNVSGRQLGDHAVPRHVRAALAEAGLPGDALRLEITESALMHDCERTEKILSEVCASGAGVHLDDFGTGHSSLAWLHQFPIEALKIDRSFVASIGADAGSGEKIIRSTVALAHSLRLKVIAEGIETVEQAQRLRALGCDYGQGFLFSEPVSAEQMDALLTGWSAEHLAHSAATT